MFPFLCRAMRGDLASPTPPLLRLRDAPQLGRPPAGLDARLAARCRPAKGIVVCTPLSFGLAVLYATFMLGGRVRHHQATSK